MKMNRIIRIWGVFLVVFLPVIVSCKKTSTMDLPVLVEMPSGETDCLFNRRAEDSFSSLFGVKDVSDSELIFDEMPDATRPALTAAAVPYDTEIPYALSVPYGSDFADFLEDISWPFWIAVLGIATIGLFLVFLIVKLSALIVCTIVESCRNEKSPVCANRIEKEDTSSLDYFSGPREGNVNYGRFGMEFKIYDYQFHDVRQPDFYRIVYRFSGSESVLVSGPISKKRAFEVLLWNRFFEEKISARQLLTQLGYDSNISLDIDPDGIYLRVKMDEHSYKYRCLFTLLSDTFAFYKEEDSTILSKIESRVSKENTEEVKEDQNECSQSGTPAESSVVRAVSQQGIDDEDRGDVSLDDFPDTDEEFAVLKTWGDWSAVPIPVDEYDEVQADEAVDFVPEQDSPVPDISEEDLDFYSTAIRAERIKDALFKINSEADENV